MTTVYVIFKITTEENGKYMWAIEDYTEVQFREIPNLYMMN